MDSVKNNRVTVDLPIDKQGFKAIWEGLGVVFQKATGNQQVTVPGRLPQGWQKRVIHRKEVEGTTLLSFAVIDKNGLPKATAGWMEKVQSHQRFATSVKLLKGDEPAKLKKEFDLKAGVEIMTGEIQLPSFISEKRSGKDEEMFEEFKKNLLENPMDKWGEFSDLTQQIGEQNKGVLGRLGIKAGTISGNQQTYKLPDGWKAQKTTYFSDSSNTMRYVILIDEKGGPRAEVSWHEVEWMNQPVAKARSVREKLQLRTGGHFLPTAATTQAFNREIRDNRAAKTYHLKNEMRREEQWKQMGKMGGFDGKSVYEKMKTKVSEAYE